MATVSEFLDRHFRHFNAATLVEAADGYVRHLESGGRVLVALGGAMSTAELGISLAEMIRRNKVHAICCTGANLEEDLFNLVAHNHYRRVSNWRNLTPENEKALEQQGLNRVTDTCIPEEQAFRTIGGPIAQLWRLAEQGGQRLFPHEFCYQLLREKRIGHAYQIDPADSWLVAACEKDLPLFVPGWEDSTLGNIFVAHVLRGELSGFGIMRSGLEYMAALADWYGCHTPMGPGTSEDPADPGPRPANGFLQIGGGIAGDFAICVAPMIRQDLRQACPYWCYFCQISDSTTSYGSYSGALPSEKITWGKLDVKTPMYVIESDATIVAPLLFARVLGW